VIRLIDVLLALLLIPVLATAEFDTLTPVTEAQPRGALTGASVFVNPGHGWFVTSSGNWSTQRGISHGLIEDHSNAEAVFQYLVPMLWNAGARVYTARERDLQTNMVIMDAGPDRYARMTGSWNLMRTPAAWGDGAFWAPTSQTDPTASIRFIPNIPEDGYYAVYARYHRMPREVGRAAATDAKFRIYHTGGVTEWVQNLNHDAGTWTYFGRYYFEKGRNAQLGSVLLDNHSAEPDAAITIDAIRFGGGMGDTVVNGKASGYPRWEESGLYYAPFMGYSPEYDTRPFNSVSAMPMWAEWECEEWELGKSVYLSWHTNAANGRARGLSSFIYGPNSWGPPSQFLGFPKGDQLLHAVHDRVVHAVRTHWENGWPDYGKITRWLGEVNPRNNNRMPAALFEYGFHDNVEDAASIIDPRFRRIAAKATLHGVIDFYTRQVDGFTTSTLPPEPPSAFHAAVTDGELRLSWLPASDESADPATHFRVMRSRNGKGFDAGGTTSRTSVRLAPPAPGETAYYRLASRNAGGESLHGETLAVRPPLPGEARVLLVNGFDRLDRDMNVVDAGGSRRGILERMNTFDYVIQHAEALAASGYGFDSISNDLVTTSVLTSYPAVVWIMGQERDAATSFSPGQRQMVAAYLEQGGRLLVSGNEWAPGLAQEPRGAEFLSRVLGIATSQLFDQPGDVRPLLDATHFGGLPIIRFEVSSTGRIYPVLKAGGITPAEGGVVFLQFGENGPPAGILSTRMGRVASMSIPFETILEADVRQALMGAIMTWLMDAS
jgi:N-acetylmuramoyl-L-alanine amidase